MNFLFEIKCRKKLSFIFYLHFYFIFWDSHQKNLNWTFCSFFLGKYFFLVLSNFPNKKTHYHSSCQKFYKMLLRGISTYYIIVCTTTTTTSTTNTTNNKNKSKKNLVLISCFKLKLEQQHTRLIMYNTFLYKLRSFYVYVNFF